MFDLENGPIPGNCKIINRENGFCTRCIDGFEISSVEINKCISSGNAVQNCKTFKEGNHQFCEECFNGYILNSEKNKCEECVLVRDHVILSKFSYSYGMCVNQGREERRRRSERSDKVPIKRLRPGLQAHDGRGSACGCHTAWLWQRRE